MSKPLITLLALSVSGSLMGLLLMLCRRGLKKWISNSFCYYAWLIVLLRLLLPLPGLLPTALPDAENEVPQVAVAEVVPSLTPSAVQADPAIRRVYSSPAYPVSDLPLDDMERGEAAEAAKSEEQDAAPMEPVRKGLLYGMGQSWEIASGFVKHLFRGLTWERAVLGLWLLGVLVINLTRMTAYNCFKRSVVEQSVPIWLMDYAIYCEVAPRRHPRLIRSAAVTEPMLLGLVKPMVVLPDQGYDIGVLRGVLAHELMHYKRKDILYKWIALFVFSLHWFNPLTRLFFMELDCACELSCDERILTPMSGSEKIRYGEALLEFAAGRGRNKQVLASAFATPKRNLKERIEQIVSDKKRNRRMTALLAAVAILVLSGCAALLGPRAISIGEESAPSNEEENISLVEPAVEEKRTEEELSELKETLNETETTIYAEKKDFVMPEIDGLLDLSPVHEPQPGDTVVSTTEELLDAIKPGASIYLNPGTYDLLNVNRDPAGSDNNHQESTFFYWRPMADDSEFVLRNLDGLKITGASAETVNLQISPRRSNVLSIEACSNIELTGLNIGHTDGGICTGGVLKLESCQNITIRECGLFGCGTLGVDATDCKGIYLDHSRIYHCSVGAMQLSACYDVLADGCDVYDCTALSLFSVENTYGFRFYNSTVFSNEDVEYTWGSELTVDKAIFNIYSSEAEIRGCRFIDNRYSHIFDIQNCIPIVMDCSFENSGKNVYLRGVAESPESGTLTPEQILKMESSYAAVQQLEEMKKLEVERTKNADGLDEVHAHNVDEFLAAIGPDTIIYLDEGTYDLSSASQYGVYGGDYYYWSQEFDGPQLVISNVKNLHIIGAGKENTTISAVPRYANVISFQHCDGVFIEKLTAGHTQEPGSCSGGVLFFGETENVMISECGLFGCGIIGVWTEQCQNVVIQDSVIYECSQGEISLWWTKNVEVNGCTFRDLGSEDYGRGYIILIGDSTSNVTMDGKAVTATIK